MRWWEAAVVINHGLSHFDAPLYMVGHRNAPGRFFWIRRLARRPGQFEQARHQLRFLLEAQRRHKERSQHG